MKCRNVLIIIASLIGVVLIILGAVLGFSVLPDYVHDELAKQVRLEDNTDQYKRWEKLPFPLIFKVYIFEILNPDEVIDGTQKPLVKERGPYVYDQSREKKEVQRDAENDTLTYKQYQYFKFNQELSGDNKEDDEIWVLNTPLMGSLQLMDILIPGLAGMYNDFWPGAFGDHPINGPFIKVKVNQFLLDGLLFCTDKQNTLCETVVDTAPLVKTLEVVDGAISFAFLRFKDNNHDGEYTITAGMDVVEDLGLIRQWEGTTELTNMWVDADNMTCNQIRGRDSTIYPPYIEEEDSFDIYSTDICRVVTVDFSGTDEYKGVKGQRRILRNDSFTNTGDNACYCLKMTPNLNGSREECLPDGFIDLYNCMAAPVILSFPHFLYADKEVAATVNGLEPNADNHVTFVTLEPGTGYPLQGAKRVQFNMALRPIQGIDIMQKLIPAMMPMIWIEEGVNLPDDLIDELNDRYLSKLVLVDAVTWTLIAVGIVLFLGFGGWFIFKKK